MGTIYRDVDSFSGSTFRAKLQNAVSQCCDDTGGQSMIIVIPEGDHEVSQPVQVGCGASDKDIIPFKIIGQPSAATTGRSRIYAPNGFIKIVNKNNTASFITIENLALYCREDPSTEPIHTSDVAIECDGRWITLKGLSISGYGKGIKISNSYNLVEDVEINECRCGIEIAPIGTTIQNCHIHSCVDYGIRTLRMSNTIPGNALNIIGLIAESNGETSYGAQIEINDTDYVTITNSYIGDDSVCAIKNNGGTHVKIANMLQSIGGSHKAIVQSGGSIECCGEYYCPDKTITGIQISGGTADFTKMKVHLSYSFIQRTGGTIFMDESKYQNGYSLSGIAGGSSFYGMFTSDGNNFMGLAKKGLWSKLGSSTINTYVPGVCYNFIFPKHLVNKTIYLHIGLENLTTAGGVDCFLQGASLITPISDFLAETINKINDAQFRFTTQANYFNVPVQLSSTAMQVAIAAPGLQGMARSKVVTISYIFANEDNRFNVPLEWTES